MIDRQTRRALRVAGLVALACALLIGWALATSPRPCARPAPAGYPYESERCP